MKLKEVYFEQGDEKVIFDDSYEFMIYVSSVFTRDGNEMITKAMLVAGEEEWQLRQMISNTTTTRSKSL